MDSKGNLYKDMGTPEGWRETQEKLRKPLTPLTEAQHSTLKPMTKRRRKNHMRNEPCVCGSGVKFKKCCWSTYF